MGATYPIALLLHSWIRWAVLILLVVVVVRAWQGRTGLGEKRETVLGLLQAGDVGEDTDASRRLGVPARRDRGPPLDPADATRQQQSVLGPERFPGANESVPF